MSRSLVKQSLRAYVIASDALFSVTAGSRFFAGIARQGSQLPYIVYHTIWGDQGLVHGEGDGLNELLIQFDAYCGGALQCEQFGEAIASALHGKTLYFDSSAVNFPTEQSPGICISPISLDSELDLVEADDEPIYRKSQDYRLTYRIT